MKSILRTIVACALFFTASVVGASEPTAEDFNKAFAEANDARKMAGKLGHEWRDTAKILRKAQETAAAGDLKKAMELVAEAKLQGEAGIVQAKRESALWEGRVIR